MLFRYIFFLILIVWLPSVGWGQKPASIDEAIAYFEREWSDADKKVYREQGEDTASIRLHHSVGMWMRNKWLWCCPNSALSKEFNSYGIYHPDDMSHIILTSLHRKLNNKPLDIKGQAEECIAYYKASAELNKKEEGNAVKNYERFNAGDSIKIYLYVDSTALGFTASQISSTDEWVFNPEKDLLVNAVILRKYREVLSRMAFFKVKITAVSKICTHRLIEAMQPGDIRKFQLKYLKVERQ